AGQILRCAYDIDMQAGNGQAAGEVDVVFERREIGCQQQIDAAGSELCIGLFEGLTPGHGQVEAEDGFVDLHPADIGGLQLRQQLRIDFQQLRQQAEAVE